MHANWILNYLKATMWLPPKQTETNSKRASQRSSIYIHTSFSPSTYLSFVSMFINGLMKKIVYMHSLTCTASVYGLTPPLLSADYHSTAEENKMEKQSGFGLCSYP